ncbi:hypothetical protein ABPG73_008527 [Tetrahymena malaccensis]
MQNKQLNNEIQSFEISQNENLNKKETINKFIFSSIQNPKQNIVDQSIKQEESQTFFMQNLNQQSFTPFDQKPIQQKFYSSPANKEESAITIDQNIYQSQYNGSPNNQKLNYKNSQTYDKFSSFNPNNKNNFEYYTQKLKKYLQISFIQSKESLQEKQLRNSIQFSKIRYSSLFLQSYDSPPINQDKKDIKTKNNYLEKQQNILDSEEQQSKYILRFLKRCNAKQDINYLDQRIFQCITGNKLV